MKILLVDIDSKIPNLAFCKIEKYYLDKGHEVYRYLPGINKEADKIYVSCVFSWNKEKCDEWLNQGAEVGGSGFDLHKTLPLEIEEVEPKINIGFTTRGCIRNCYFCIVPRKEGKIRVVGDIYNIWDGRSKELVLLDNNILALPEHFIKITQQLIKEGLRVDFNQGLDHRLLTPEICKLLLKLKHKNNQIKFAFDDLRYKPSVLRALKVLRAAGLKDWGSRWLVYVGKQDTFENVYERLSLLRKHKQMAFVMRDREIYNKKEFIMLAAWANNCVGGFKRYSLQELICISKRFSGYKWLVEEKLA